MILSSEELNLVTGGGLFKSCLPFKNKSYNPHNFQIGKAKPIGIPLITLKFKNRRWRVIPVK